MIEIQQKYIDLHTHNAASEPDIFSLFCVLRPGSLPRSGCFSAGIHPQEATRHETKSFLKLWQDPRCAAVGECGLDRRFPDLPKQLTLFREQARIAENLGKPLLIHSVRTHEEILKTAKDFSAARPWIIHGFRGKERTLFTLLDAGFYISFGTGLLKDAGNMEPFFHKVPTDRIFFESDADPGADVRAVYALAASMLGTSVDELAEQVRANYRKVFGE